MPEYTVTVSIHSLVDTSQLSKNDKKLDGKEYVYTVDADDEDEACDGALDRFHGEIGIEHLDHFDIEAHAADEGENAGEGAEEEDEEEEDEEEDEEEGYE